MHTSSGHKSSRTNVSVRGRNSLLKQNTAESFHGTVNDEYFQNSVKSPVSSKTQAYFSPAKKIAITPTSAKNSNEYYFKAKEVTVQSLTNRKKAVKNPSMNINTEFQTTNESGYEKSNKAMTTRELKVKSSGKMNFVPDVNPALDLASIDHGLKSGGPNSASSPKTKIQKAPNSSKAQSKASEYYASSTNLTKDQIPTHSEMSPECRDSNELETRSTGSGSHRRSSTRQDLNWAALKLPVEPQLVLENFPSYLSPYEKEEIKKYNQIYYISDIYHKIIARSEQEYEDERGDYLVVKNDHIRYRYEALEMLGRGSFGQVIKVYDHKRKEYAAVKVIRSPKKFHFQAKIEIRVLKYMMEQYGADYNIIGLRDYFMFRNHVCLVFDLMDVNLYDLLKKNNFKGFPLNTIRKFAIQVLYALKFLSHHRIIHCDLKPENILLKHPNKTGIKLIDFGSSCFENEKLYTYIQSRFYRSPEIILGLPYSTQIDMWSFGCLLCELYLGYPVFAGDSERDQLLNMFEVLGVPDRELIDISPRKNKFFDDDLNPIIVPNTKGKIRVPNSTPINSLIKPEDAKFLELVMACLEYDSDKRFSPDQALAHEWIIEGLPPQLQIQHLKFIQDTTQAGATTPNTKIVAAQSTRHQVEQQPNTPAYYNQESGRSHGSTDKVAQSLSVRGHNTQEEKSVEKSKEPAEKDSPQNKQKRFFTRKLNGVQKDKFSLKGTSRPLENQPSSTRNLYELSSQREIVTPTNRKGNFETSQGRTPQKKGESRESFGRSNLVAWESPGRKPGSIEDKNHKQSAELNQAKKSPSYYNFYSLKMPQSLERNLAKSEKDMSFTITKAALLPSLKYSSSQKNK